MRTITTSLILFFLVNTTFAQKGKQPLEITQLSGDFYIYTTYNTYKGEKVPANGMYLVTSKGVVLFDTLWDTTQFQPLLDSIQVKHHQQVLLCVATHFHADRTGGLAYYKTRGIKTYTSKRTDELSKKNGMKRAEYRILNDTVFTVGQYSFQTYFPGHGHAPDNVVIWFEKEKILYGACLIKSVEDTDLGYLGDASKEDYASAIKNVQAKCKHPKHVIVGHGDYSNIKALEYTLKMAEELKRKN